MRILRNRIGNRNSSVNPRNASSVSAGATRWAGVGGERDWVSRQGCSLKYSVLAPKSILLSGIGSYPEVLLADRGVKPLTSKQPAAKRER